jgi:hypothetical protein
MEGTVMMPRMSNLMPSMPIFTFHSLPTLDRPRIVLHGDQGSNLADARIDNMPVAPVLHYAVGMVIRSVTLSIPVLAVGWQAKKDKTTQH